MSLPVYLRSHIHALILITLGQMTGNPTIAMCYKTFSKLRTHHRIVLMGWPRHLALVEPGRHSVSVARSLLSGWRTGEIRFERVALDELVRIEAEEKNKGRKVRSDKGRIRERRGPDTCGKPLWSNRLVVSREFITESEDEIVDAENAMTEPEDEISEYED